MTDTITSYKGFDKDLKCRGFQFALGQTFTHEGPVKSCSSGFHACEHPLGVLAFYAPNSSRFAVVEQSGDLSRQGNESKVASRVITVKKELYLPDLTRAAVEYTFSRAQPIDPGSPALATGSYGAALATHSYDVALATGSYGAASATGRQGAALATNGWGAALATGSYGAASATGDWGTALAIGPGGAASARGDQEVAIAVGYQGKALASETSAIVLVYRDKDGVIVHIRASKVGENGIKAGTWYSLDEFGEFVEVS